MAGGDQQCANDADTALAMAAGVILGVVLSKKKSGDVRCAPASQLAHLRASRNRIRRERLFQNKFELR